MFEDREEINNPTVMIRKELDAKEFIYISEKRVGKFYRVIPNSAREVFYIQMLLKNVDMLVPQEGDGMLISARAVESCDYRS
tara:strand:+ start:284 stop:529 length:246 start_codon:yes stop_codon:yes gene_type:complete